MGIPRVFTVSAEHTSLTTDTQLMQITAPATGPLQILSATIANTANETNEQLQVKISVASTIGSQVPAALTPTANDGSDTASGATVLHVLTTPAILGTPPRYFTGFPSLPGWTLEPRLAETFIIPAGKTWVIEILGTSGSFSTINTITQVSYRETETNAPILE